jgi:hypothetical protein
MYSKLILLFATAVIASPGHFKLDIRREYASASSLRERELGEPLELAIGASVSGQFPSPSQTTNQQKGSSMIVPGGLFPLWLRRGRQRYKIQLTPH